jgi:hypothetical protein
MWSMNISIPFPFPSRKCVKRDVQLDSDLYVFEIHNHFDRLFQYRRDGKGLPKVHLVGKDAQSETSEEVVTHREHLQSVAVFRQKEVFSCGSDAFARAAEKIKLCTQHLANFLSMCQKTSPYLTAWLVYPYSTFEVGTVYHDVVHRESAEKPWHLCSCSVAMSLARHLQKPMFFLDVPDSDVEGIMSVTNELLAEAMMSLYRGMPRMTVLSAYGAIESLARNVLIKRTIEALDKKSTPPDVAKDYAERLVAGKKMDLSYLFHSELNKQCGRSLCNEHKDMFDRLQKLQQLRNAVAHEGHKPTKDEARDGHRLSCEVAQWLAEVGGYEVKPLLPQESDIQQGLSVISADSFAKSEKEMEVIRRLMGSVQSK